MEKRPGHNELLNYLRALRLSREVVLAALLTIAAAAFIAAAMLGSDMSEQGRKPVETARQPAE